MTLSSGVFASISTTYARFCRNSENFAPDKIAFAWRRASTSWSRAVCRISKFFNVKSHDLCRSAFSFMSCCCSFMAVSLASSAATLSASAVAFSPVLFVMSRVFSSIDLFVSFTYVSYAFCASVSALIASASSVSVSRMLCSNIPMTPPAPEDCLYSLKPGGGGGPTGSCFEDTCKNFFAKTAASTSYAFFRSAFVSRWSATVVWKSLFSISRSSPARFSCVCISAISASSVAMDFVSSSMVVVRSEISASSSEISRALSSDSRSFVFKPSVQKSLCLISSAFSFKSAAIISSMAAFTFVNASRRTRAASAAKRGLPLALAALKRSSAASSRCLRSFVSTFVCTKLKVRVIARQDGERLAHGLDLLRARLLALLPLLVRHLAGLLQVHQELLVRREGVPRVLEVLLRLRELLVRVRELLRLRVLELSSGLDLSFLRRLEVLVRGLRLHLFLLGSAQVRLERLLHLLEDPEDLTRLRRVALLEGRLRVEVVTRRLHERRDRLALGRRHNLFQHESVLLELVVDDSGHVQERFGRHLSERLRVVLGEHDDRRLERTDGLEHVLLLLVELGELLLAHRGRLVERLLVLRDLRLQVLDLRVQARARGRQLLDRGRQVRDAGLSLCDGRGLFLVVRLAPARNLLVGLLVLLGLLLQLSLHVLQQVDHLRHRAVLCIASIIAGRHVRQRCFDSKQKAQGKHCG